MGNYQESMGKRIWRLVYPSLTYTAVTLLVGTIVTMIIAMGMIGQLDPTVGLEQLQNLILSTEEEYYKHLVEIQGLSALLTLPILVFYLRKDRERRTEVGFVSPAPERIPAWMVLVTLFGAIASYAGNGMISLSGLYQVSDEYDKIAEMIYQGNVVLELVAMAILTPIVEELIFRGLMYTQLTEFMKKKHAIIIAALLFGLYHGNFLQTVYAFALGLLMIYVYERFHTLLAPILFHIGSNALGILISETPIFDFLFMTEAMMYTTVIVSSLLIIGVVWLIEQREQRKWKNESEQAEL